MNRPPLMRRIVVAAVLLAVAAAIRPVRVDAAVHGLWRNPHGVLFCGADCQAGQQCCEIKILPVDGGTT